MAAVAGAMMEIAATKKCACPIPILRRDPLLWLQGFHRCLRCNGKRSHVVIWFRSELLVE